MHLAPQLPRPRKKEIPKNAAIRRGHIAGFRHDPGTRAKRSGRIGRLEIVLAVIVKRNLPRLRAEMESLFRTCSDRTMAELVRTVLASFRLRSPVLFSVVKLIGERGIIL